MLYFSPGKHPILLKQVLYCSIISLLVCFSDPVVLCVLTSLMLKMLIQSSCDCLQQRIEGRPGCKRQAYGSKRQRTRGLDLI